MKNKKDYEDDILQKLNIKYRTSVLYKNIHIITDESGNKFWYNKKTQLHREDGPAIVREDGKKYWYLNGIEYTETNWRKELEKRKDIKSF